MLPYVHVVSNETDIKNLDTSVSRVFDSIFPNPLLNSPSLITDLIFVSGVDNYVSHKLGRPPRGYILVSSDSPASIYTSSTVNDSPSLIIILKSNASISGSILFF